MTNRKDKIMNFTVTLALIAVTIQAVQLNDSKATITSSDGDAKITLSAFSHDDLIEELLPQLIASNAEIGLDISFDDFNTDDIHSIAGEFEKELCGTGKDSCGCGDNCASEYGEDCGCEGDHCGDCDDCEDGDCDLYSDDDDNCAGGICMPFDHEVPDISEDYGLISDSIVGMSGSVKSLGESLADSGASFVQIDMPEEIKDHTLTMALDFSEGLINFVNVPDVHALY